MNEVEGKVAVVTGAAGGIGAAIVRTFAAEGAAGPDNIDVNSVPLRRIGEPDDVADVVLFLASRRARYITGCTIDITGGVYMN